MVRKIEIVDYRPEWEKQFKVEAKKIKSVLGKNCTAVHHIGSTAVKGLKAKPIIDIMPVVKDLSLADACNAEFEALGYECKGEYGISGRRFFVKGGGEYPCHIHLFEDSNQEAVDRHLAVRDYLRSNENAVKEYGERKAALAEQYMYDSEGYCKGKDAFLKELEQKALKWSKKQNDIGTCMAMGMCFGAALGSAFGSLFSNMSIGMCFGVSIGMCLGLAVGYGKNNQES